MKVIGEKRGGCGTLPCDNCNGKTGYLYVIEKEGTTSNICTSCKSVMSLVAEGKGDIVTRLWKMKTGKEFEDRT